MTECDDGFHSSSSDSSSPPLRFLCGRGMNAPPPRPPPCRSACRGLVRCDAGTSCRVGHRLMCGLMRLRARRGCPTGAAAAPLVPRHTPQRHPTPGAQGPAGCLGRQRSRPAEAQRACDAELVSEPRYAPAGRPACAGAAPTPGGAPRKCACCAIASCCCACSMRCACAAACCCCCIWRRCICAAARPVSFGTARQASGKQQADNSDRPRNGALHGRRARTHAVRC